MTKKTKQVKQFKCCFSVKYSWNQLVGEHNIKYAPVLLSSSHTDATATEEEEIPASLTTEP